MDIKTALHSLWHDTCSVIEYHGYARENKSTGQRELVVLENVPCKLSFQSLQTVNQTDTAARIEQGAKLFIDKDITIKAGSKIVVTRGQRTFAFKQSGEAGVFTNHQEIQLLPFEELA